MAREFEFFCLTTGEDYGIIFHDNVVVNVVVMLSCLLRYRGFAFWVLAEGVC